MNYEHQRLAGRRLYIGGQVQVCDHQLPQLYFVINVPDGPYYLTFNIATMEFEGACTCAHDSLYGLQRHECRHCYAVRVWIKAELREFVEAQGLSSKRIITPLNKSAKHGRRRVSAPTKNEE